MSDRPASIAIACPSLGNLTWTTARKEHACLACGRRAAEPGQRYLRNQYPENWEAVEAFCLDCAWRLFAPDGEEEPPRPIPPEEPRPEAKPGWPLQQHECGRGCLVDEHSPQWREIKSAREKRLVQRFERLRTW